jgi:hypothetical protein
MKTATCRCGKGKVSAYDNKCGHCRSRKEQWAYERGRLRGNKPNEWERLRATAAKAATEAREP